MFADDIPNVVRPFTSYLYQQYLINSHISPLRLKTCEVKKINPRESSHLYLVVFLSMSKLLRTMSLTDSRRSRNTGLVRN